MFVFFPLLHLMGGGVWMFLNYHFPQVLGNKKVFELCVCVSFKTDLMIKLCRTCIWQLFTSTL